MTKVLEHKGYFGSIEFELEEDGGYLHGKLLFIRDVISYRADDLKTVKTAFAAAVDDYLEMCRELGEKPDTPCKGSFNVRLGAELHQEVALDAHVRDVSLNEWVKDACQLKLGVSRADKTARVEPKKRPAVLMESIIIEEQQSFERDGVEDWQNPSQNFH